MQASKLSFEQSFQEMALDKALADELSELDGTLADGFENEDFGFLR